MVTVQTKSGTNNFHGSAYDYRRSNANLARNPFTQSPNPATPNKLGGLIPGGLYSEFGGSVGGPINERSRILLRRLSGTAAESRHFGPADSADHAC